MENAIHRAWKSQGFPTPCKQRFPQLHDPASYTHSHNACFDGGTVHPSHPSCRKSKKEQEQEPADPRQLMLPSLSAIPFWRSVRPLFLFPFPSLFLHSPSVGQHWPVPSASPSFPAGRGNIPGRAFSFPPSARRTRPGDF